MPTTEQIIAGVNADILAAEHKRRADEMSAAADQIRSLLCQRDDSEARNKADAASHANDAKRVRELEANLMNLDGDRASELLVLRHRMECAQGAWPTSDLDGKLIALQRRFPALYQSIVDEHAKSNEPAPAVPMAGGKEKR